MTGSSSDGKLSVIVEANRHLGKLFEEPLGQRGLPELLTAFSGEEVEKMKAIPGEKEDSRSCIWIGALIKEFAKMKCIGLNSLNALANRINCVDKENRYCIDVGYDQIDTLNEMIRFLDNSFEDEKTTLDQKFCYLIEMKQMFWEIQDFMEDKLNGSEEEANPFWVTYDVENLFLELEYRYALHFLETLLQLN